MSNPVIDSDGNQRWYNSDNELHREDGPAIIYAHGSQAWYLNGKRHREDGPAVIWENGEQTWWLNHLNIRSNKEFQEVSGISDEDMTVMVLKYGNVY